MLAMSNFVSDFDTGPGEPLPQSGVSLAMPNFAGDVDILQVPEFVSVIDPGPGNTSPESKDILAMPDLVSNFDPRPGEPLLKSGVGLDMPNLDSDLDILQMPDFVSAIDPGPRTTSPESGDILAVPDFVSNLFGSGGPIPGDRHSDSCHSVMCTSPPDPGGDDVSSLSVRPVLPNVVLRMTRIIAICPGPRSSRRGVRAGSLSREVHTRSSRQEFVLGVVPGLPGVLFSDTSFIVCIRGSQGSI